MKRRARVFTLTVVIGICVMILSLSSFIIAANDYQVTASVIQALVQDEDRAHQTYIAYSRKAAEKIIPVLPGFSLLLPPPNQFMLQISR